MTGNRGRRSRLHVWVAVPITGLLAGAGLAALTAHGLDNARSDAVTTGTSEPAPPGSPIETAS